MPSAGSATASWCTRGATTLGCRRGWSSATASWWSTSTLGRPTAGPGTSSSCSPRRERAATLIAAADAGREGRLRVLGLTGPAPNPLAERCDEILTVDAEATANVQEAHLVALHLICAVVESAALNAASSVTATAEFPQPVRLHA